MVDLLVPSPYNIHIQLGNNDTTARQHMSIPANNDTTAAIIKRIANSNNQYTFTYDRNALEATLNVGSYTATPHVDFAGDNYWSIKKR